MAGAIFTLPALYILKLDPHPLQTILHLPGRRLPGRAVPDPAAPLLRARHARHASRTRRPPPSPRCWSPAKKADRRRSCCCEATAIAGVYDFLVTTFQVWKEYLDFQFVPAMRMLSERAKVVVSFDAIGFILGLGYVMGLRSSMILCAGGVLSNLVLVPLVWMIGREHTDRGLSGADPHRQDDGHRDLPRLCALRGRGRHRHGGHLRHHEIHAHRGRLVRRRRCGPFACAEKRIRRAHRPRHHDDDHPAGRDRQRASPWRLSRQPVGVARGDPDRAWRWRWCSRSSSPASPPTPSPPPRAIRCPA